MPEVTLDVPGVGALPAYFSPASAPDTKASQRSPGVVVVHEAFGLSDDIRAIADHVAEIGFHAVAPDLMSYGGTVRCLVGLTRAMATGEGRPFAELDAARAWLAARPDCTGAVGVAGFCLGGGFALLLANRGFDASAVQYGALPRKLDAAVAGACPIVASYGGRDASLRGAATRLDAALVAAGVEHDVKEYADAGHSFMNHSSVPGWMRPATRPLHAGYVETAATDAWDRIQTLFDRALRADEVD
jgi:carboxymethylenebutenolidase